MALVKTLMPAACSLLVTVGPQFRLLNAIALMESSGIGLQVVCGLKHRIVGIVTEAQIRRLPMPVHTDMCIADIMRRDVVCCVPEDRLNHIWTIMKMCGLSALPIVDCERRPLGVLSDLDIARSLQGIKGAAKAM